MRCSLTRLITIWHMLWVGLAHVSAHVGGSSTTDVIEYETQCQLFPEILENPIDFRKITFRMMLVETSSQYFLRARQLSTAQKQSPAMLSSTPQTW